MAEASAGVGLPPKVRAQRQVRPDRVAEGTPVTCELAASNASRYTSPDLELIETIAGHPVRFHLGGLAGRATMEVYRYELPTYRRGVYRLRPLSISRLDPVRLVRRGVTTGKHTTFYVHPTYHRLRTL